MTINDTVTDVQHAREIIGQVGEKYQRLVSNKLREMFYYSSNSEDDKLAKEAISNIEAEYVLNTANVLWKDKFEEIPQWQKDYED